MQNWLKSTAARFNLPARWAAGGLALALLALGGLCVLGPADNNPSPPEFFLHLILLSCFGIGWMTLIIAFNCWVLFTFSAEAQVYGLHHRKTEAAVRNSHPTPGNPLLVWSNQVKAAVAKPRS